MEIDLRPSSRTKGIVDRQAILLNELFCIANVFFFLDSPLFSSLGSSSLRQTQSGMDRSPDSDFWLISTVSVATMASKVAIVLDSSKQLSPAPFSSSSSSLIAILFLLLLLFSLFCACCSSLPWYLKLSLLADHYKSVVHDLTEQIDPPSRDHNGRATTTENPFFFFFFKKKCVLASFLFSFPSQEFSWLHSNIKPAMAINSRQQIPEFSGPYLPPAPHTLPNRIII